MARDAQLLALFAALHAVGIGVVTVLLVMFLRSGPTRPRTARDEDDGDGGGGSDRPGPPAPHGPRDDGLPLPADARPARFRLRDETGLRERFAAPARRPVREPAPRPGRTPARG